jgi:hypothetical protein
MELDDLGELRDESEASLVWDEYNYPMILFGDI